MNEESSEVFPNDDYLPINEQHIDALRRNSDVSNDSYSRTRSAPPRSHSTPSLPCAVIYNEPIIAGYRAEDSFNRQKNNLDLSDRKHISKALDVLGHDPSQEKVIQFFGMDDDDYQQFQDEKIEAYENTLRRKRSNSVMNRRSTTKAQRVLGIYPSKDKVIDKLGIDTSVVDLVQYEQSNRWEEFIKRKRNNFDKINKKNIQKALKVLGHDPSEIKLEATLGVNKEVIQNIIRKNSIGENDQHPSDLQKPFWKNWTGIAFSTSIIAVGIVISYYLNSRS